MLTLTHTDGELDLHEHFIPEAEARRILEVLLHELAWADEYLVMFGKSVRAPRRVCWYGDSGAAYRYSGICHEPLPWTPTLLELKQRIEQATQQRFNSVLANLYRDGNDSMGWHADKEKELGMQPYIASLSFGAARVFRAQHRHSKENINVTLAAGSLLTMHGEFQKHWRHSVPKQNDAVMPRINLTFRYVQHTFNKDKVLTQ